MIHATLTGELKFDEKSYLHLSEYLSTSYLLIRNSVTGNVRPSLNTVLILDSSSVGMLTSWF